MRREYDEPFVVEDAAGRDPRLDARLDRGRARPGLRVTHGGRVHHLTGPADKGRGAPRARRHGWPGGVDGDVVGLGDAANDLPLLLAVDPPDRHAASRRARSTPPSPRASAGASARPAPGPAGWTAAVLAVLAGEPLPRVGA